MKNRNIVLLSVVVIAAILAVYFGFIKHPLIKQATAPTGDLAIFSNSYVTGYEGDFMTVSYKFTYPKNLFSFKSKVTTPSEVSIKNISSGATSTIKFFYNGAAGFSSAKELWDMQFESQCPDCILVKNNFDYQSNDIATFANATDEWIIFSQIPGFVIADLKKPISSEIEILGSLSVSQTPAQMPEFSTVKVYFANNKISPIGNDCKNLAPVERQIIKTPQVATAAIELLLDGPTADEINSGYNSSIPSGSDLNSITIRNGTAYADFNKTTEAGGGSCSMAMRVAQIKQTLLQFPTIKNVILSIDGQTEPVFQP